MSSDFLFRYSTLEPVIWSCAKSYEIEGVLSTEDLYQEGLIELNKTISLDFYKNLPRDQFSSYFRVRLSSKFRRLLAYHTRKKRDWRSTVSLETNSHSTRSTYSSDSDAFDYDYDVSQVEGDDKRTPETELEDKQKEKELDEFIEAVRCALDTEAREVFDCIWKGEIPDDIKDQYIRVPDHMSVTVIAKIFGWNREKAWCVINRIRRLAILEVKRRVRSNSLLWNKENTKSIINKRFGVRKKPNGNG